MKGDKTLKLLEILKDAALDSSDYLDAFLTSGYGASLNELEYKVMDGKFRKRIKRVKRELSKSEQIKLNNRFYAMVSNLEKDGLIEKSTKSKNTYFKITTKGEGKISFVKKIKARTKELPVGEYENEKSSRTTIVMFDIPEKERNKRRWLRLVLKKMEFEMVQKSVWMGKVKIPKEFLKNLDNMKIISFVEIFEITKTGSLRKVS